MPLIFPTYQQIIDRIRSDVAQNLPGADPTIFGSFVRAFADSEGGRSFDIVVLQQQLLDQMFPQTATGEFLLRWAGYEDLTLNAATESSGPATVTGTATSVIPTLSEYTSAAGNVYITQSEATLSLQTISVSTLTRIGTTATATTASEHKLASGMTVDMAGANETDYNGSFVIIVISATEFTYEVTGAPTTPATGAITVSFTGAFVDVQSQDVQDTANGIDVNLDSGAQLGLTLPISGVDATAIVQFDGVTGGTDEETDDELRARTFQSRANPVANFNVAAIEKQALSVAGVTRVLVKRITPYVGAVTVLFVRDNDDNIIPDAGEVQTVEDAVVEILQASSDEADVFVLAPTPVTTNYAFSTIFPDTTTMRSAIELNLAAFYTDTVTFEQDITEDKYRAAIINTVDTDTGDELLSFTLTNPTGDVTIGTNEIGVLGTVTF